VISRLSQLVRRHPLAAFLVLTYGLSWALWIPLAIFRDAASGPYSTLALLIGSNIPSAVAIVLTLVGFGKGATRKLLGQLLIWRVGWRWYLRLRLSSAPSASLPLPVTARQLPSPCPC
jgi:CAAX protease family protein